MVNQPAKYRDAIFVITEEKSCPIYNPGEELKIVSFRLTVPSFKASCLSLTAEISKIVTSPESFDSITKLGAQITRFDCGGHGGCGGMIYFEFKKEKEFATLQMKLLNETEKRRKRQHLDKFFDVLRNLDVFESLDDDALSDLTLLLELKTIPADKVVLKKGEPGSYLYIILSGRVEVIADDRSRLAEMGTGDIFGEMSLLSGEPVTSSVHTITDTEVAMLSSKNFKHVLKKYSILQIFLFKLMVKRAQTMSLRSGKISSGMSGELSEISTVDLFQLINSSQKTGRFDLILDQGKAVVFFKEGEIVHARFLDLLDQDAIFALVGVKNGHFIYTKGIPEELEKTPPVGGFMGLIMEGLQRIDEHV